MDNQKGNLTASNNNEKNTRKKGGRGPAESKYNPFRVKRPAEPAASRLERGGAIGLFGRKSESYIRNRQHLWEMNAMQMCEPESQEPVREEKDDLMSIIRESRTAEALLFYNEGAAPELVFDNQIESAGYHADSGKILINPNRSKPELLFLLARELRRSWQDRRDMMFYPLLFEPEEAIIVNRAQIADSHVIASRIAWELKLSGRDDVWQWLIGSSLAPVARAYAREAARDFRSVNNGMAARMAYDLWFEGNISRHYDRELIHEMLVDDFGYVFDEDGPLLHATNDALIRIGEIPGGGNYMSIAGKRLPGDESYGAVLDRSNANFLWFIKFERSFALAEKKHDEQIEEFVENEAEIVDFCAYKQEIEEKSVPEENTHLPVSLAKNSESKVYKLDYPWLSMDEGCSP